MNNIQLTRTLRLIRRTGDKAVVMDPESDQVFVLMDVDKYEGMLDELELFDPENEGNDDGDFSSMFPADEDLAPESTTDVFVDKPTQDAPEDDINIHSKSLDFSEAWESEKNESSHSNILSEDSLDDVPHDEEIVESAKPENNQPDEEEDGEEEVKFYLEPVE